MSIEAMKQALYALEQFGEHYETCPDYVYASGISKCDCGYNKERHALRQAIEQAERPENFLDAIDRVYHEGKKAGIEEANAVNDVAKTEQAVTLTNEGNKHEQEPSWGAVYFIRTIAELEAEIKRLQVNVRDQTALHLLYKGDYEDLLAKTEQKHNFCSDCGKFMPEGGIHTCSPQVKQQFYPDWDMIKPLTERIAELEAQLHELGKGCAECGKKESDGWALYCVECVECVEKASKPEQEPVAWVRDLTSPQPHCVTSLKYRSVADTDAGVKYIPVYAAPPSHPVALKRFADLIRADERERIKKEQQNCYVNKEIIK